MMSLLSLTSSMTEVTEVTEAGRSLSSSDTIRGFSSSLCSCSSDVNYLQLIGNEED